MKKLIALFLALALTPVLANDFFNASGVPSTGAALVSSTIRTEFSNIGGAFDKMPGLTGNGSKILAVNPGATALEAITSTTARTYLGLTIGANVQAWDTDLDALAALAATPGMLVRSGAGAFTVRTLTGTANEITVTNGDGSAGAPTFSLPAALTFTGKTVTNATFVNPALGTPASGVATNLTGTAAGLTAGNVTTNANLTGPITSAGNATSVAAQTGTGTTFVMQASPVLTTPNLGTPTAAVLTNATGTAAGLTAGNVTTNANLTGLVTSVGNATTLNLAAISNTLGGDVALTPTGTNVDGPSIAQGATGTWFAIGTVTYQSDVSPGEVNCKIWDGTTVKESAQADPVTTNRITVTLSGIFVSPPGNIRITCNSTINTGKLKFNASGNSADSSIKAFRIQ